MPHDFHPTGLTIRYIPPDTAPGWLPDVEAAVEVCVRCFEVAAITVHGTLPNGGVMSWTLNEGVRYPDYPEGNCLPPPAPPRPVEYAY